ncbi:hypothetical protein RND81_06G144400 [Saponaria officinalis]|uniref:Uncharacterized protein ycf33 n=1 Tax=Saponaria officinalis TaxID=3572 RepID=A0AAW1KBF3_SAPOF
MMSALIKNQPSYNISTIESNIIPKTLSSIPNKATIWRRPYLPRKSTQITISKTEHHIKKAIESAGVVKKENEMGRRMVIGGAALVMMMMTMMEMGHDKAWALGPEGPLMEEFWENVRRYGLYALTVSTGVLYSVFQPIYELLKNPISALLVIIIIGGTFFIGSQILSAMVGLSDFDYQYAY